MTEQQPDYALSKEKYLNVFKTEGLKPALTELHHDMDKLELECFESKGGFKPEIWKVLKEYREFSIELFNLNYTDEEVARRAKEEAPQFGGNNAP